MTRRGLVVVCAVLVAGLGGWLAWGRHHSASAAPAPYTVSMDCMHYSSKTGRVLMKVTVHSLLDRPFPFRAHLIVAVLHHLPPRPGGTADATRYASVSAASPRVVIHPGQTYTWSTYSRPVLLNGSTEHLEAGGCTFWASAPRPSR